MQLSEGDFLYHSEDGELMVVIGESDEEYQFATPNWTSIPKEEIEELVSDGSVIYWRQDMDDYELGTGEFKFFFSGNRMQPIDGEDDEQEIHTEDGDIIRKHWYSFKATGDEYAYYYLEVEDGGNMLPSTVNGGVVENEYYWISDDGTKAAGRVEPGVTHTYAFDTLVADVTIDGEIHPMVDGRESNLSYYPRDTASGNYWKTGFWWQEPDYELPNGDRPDGGPMGGGDGYEHVVTYDDADTVVVTKEGFADALSNASHGDVIYIDDSAEIDLGSDMYTVPAGVTLASSRGVNGSNGGLLYTEYEAGTGFYSLTLSSESRLTGLRLQGPYYEYFSPDFYAAGAGATVRGDDVMVDNCEIWGFAYAGVRVDTGAPHIHHNNIHHNPRAGLGYGVANAGGDPLIEWNEFDANRHSIACSGDGGYVARYNHVGPITFSHVFDVHKPGGIRYEIYNNTIEAVDAAHDGSQQPGVAIRGVPDEVATITDNWFYNPTPPLDTPTGRFSGEAIIQVGVDEWENVEFSGNHYGSTEPADDIGHPR